MVATSGPGHADGISNVQAPDAKASEEDASVPEHEVPTGWVQAFMKLLTLQPLCMCFLENAEGDDLKEKLETLAADLALEKQRHKATQAALHDLQQAHREQCVQLEETKKRNDMQTMDLTHLEIERNTLKAALSSIFDANKMVKRDILHVEESQDVDDSPILSGVSTPSRRISMDHHALPHSPRTHDVLHTVRNSLLSHGSTDSVDK